MQTQALTSRSGEREVPSLTWATHVDIHAISIRIPLRRRQGHGWCYSDVSSNQVVLSPLAAIHGVLSAHTRLLYLEAQESRFSQGVGGGRGTVWVSLMERHTQPPPKKPECFLDKETGN